MRMRRGWYKSNIFSNVIFFCKGHITIMGTLKSVLEVHYLNSRIQDTLYLSGELEDEDWVPLTDLEVAILLL